jgi:hypothetical protein
MTAGSTTLILNNHKELVPSNVADLDDFSSNILVTFAYT